MTDPQRSWPLEEFELADTGLHVTHPQELPDDLVWRPAVVPGGVHESLIAAGELEHPFVGGNERAAAWIEQRAWWFRATFTLTEQARTAERVRLVFHGLDTVAAIWLNGVRLGTHENAFRPAVFELTGTEAEGNTLLIRFAPPLAGLTAPKEIAENAERLRSALMGMLEPAERTATAPPGVLSTGPELTLRRKPTYSWGWDFAPRLPSIGIHRPVEIVAEGGAAITGHHVHTVSIDSGGRAVVEVEVEACGESALVARVTLTGPDGSNVGIELPLAEVAFRTWRATGRVVVEAARLWWTHDLGDQPLYTLTVDLADAAGPVGRVSDRIGLRTIELDRSEDPDEGGRLFRFLLNGRPVYARGANWIPPSMLIGSVPDTTYRGLVELACEANMTMLRVWGGGTYEHDAFYAACDELGVLVWQDFMFACMDYPSEDPGLRAEVAAEADFQVRRLRNHPSLALWCGNNEIEGMHRRITGSLAPGNWGWSFFHELLPDAVARHCASVPYWPGSPWAEPPARINGITDGDRHAWEVWHGADLGAGGPAEFGSPGEAMHWDRYRHDKGRFISEFGIHACPEPATLRRWTPDEPLELGSAALLRRIKDLPKNKGDALMQYETGLPQTLEQYADFSMACQAEGLKAGVEHYRRRQPHNSGTLVWQLNDCWPGLSWSVIDYDLVPKAGYYALQRAYHPVIASFEPAGDQGDGLVLWVTNSTLAAVGGTALIELADIAGERTPEIKIPFELGPMESREIWRGPALAPGGYAWVSEPAGLFPANRIFADRLKEIDFGASELTATIEPGGTAVRLSSRGFSFMARVTTGVPGCRFSSNYLDLRDGDEHTITITGLPEGFDPAGIAVASYGPRQATVPSHPA